MKESHDDLKIIERDNFKNFGGKNYQIWIFLVLINITLTSTLIPSLYSLVMILYMCLFIYLWALNIAFQIEIFYRVSLFLVAVWIGYIIASYVLFIPYFQVNLDSKWVEVVGIITSREERQYAKLTVYLSNIILYFCLLFYFKTRK